MNYVNGFSTALPLMVVCIIRYIPFLEEAWWLICWYHPDLDRFGPHSETHLYIILPEVNSFNFYSLIFIFRMGAIIIIDEKKWRWKSKLKLNQDVCLFLLSDHNGCPPAPTAREDISLSSGTPEADLQCMVCTQLVVWVVTASARRSQNSHRRAPQGWIHAWLARVSGSLCKVQLCLRWSEILSCGAGGGATSSQGATFGSWPAGGAD